MAGRPRIPNPNPMLEFRANNNCWYTVDSLGLSKDRQKLSVRFLNMDKNFDEVYGCFETTAEFKNFLNRFRDVSVPSKEEDCKDLEIGSIIRASLDEDRRMFYDGLIVLVDRKFHNLKGGERKCECEFSVRWIAGPRCGNTEQMRLEYISNIQQGCKLDDDDKLAAFYEAHINIESGNTRSRGRGRPPKKRQPVGTPSVQKKLFSEFCVSGSIEKSSELSEMAESSNRGQICEETGPIEQSAEAYISSLLEKKIDRYRSDIERVKLDTARYSEPIVTSSGRIDLLQNEIAFARTSKDNVVKQINSLFVELESLSTEIHTVREDHQLQVAEVVRLTAEVVKYQEIAGKYLKDFDELSAVSATLEETYSSRSEAINILQQQLDAAHLKMQVLDSENEWLMTQCQAQKTLADDLEDQVAGAEIQVFEGKKLQEELEDAISKLRLEKEMGG